ncbi:hypothetical protein B0H13DRAFT_2310202 [Mycena leptocephala]|nr:hypothetical protein B0H13DRAFT_2310202 [Mycena leptocephala]
MEQVHADVLERYGNEDDLDLAIAEDQDHHFRHEAIDVAEKECPFSSKEATAVFFAALEEVKSAGIIPKNLGRAAAEWEGTFYPETEVAWAQALELMVRIQAAENHEIII